MRKTNTKNQIYVHVCNNETKKLDTIYIETAQLMYYTGTLNALTFKKRKELHISCVFAKIRN